MTLWAGRQSTTMSDAMRALNDSLTVDIRLLPYDLRVNRAWAWELHQIHLLTGEEYAAIEQTLGEMAGGRTRDEGRPLASTGGSLGRGTTTDEDVHSLVERWLTEKLGEVGAKIHAGKSRNDQVVTDLRLYLKDAIAELQNGLRAAVAVLCTQARAHADTIMPGYTHLQQAQPVLLAHYLLGQATALREDHARCGDVLRRIDQCPLGSGALAGSGFPIDRQALAQSLGFAAPTPNSMHAVSNRDDCLDTAAACAICMNHLSRVCEDLILWSTQEFGFVTLADAVTTGSSMMPQKKNPDALELIRGKTARVIGQMQTLFTLMKGLPLTYARDLQEDKPAVFDCLDQTQLSLTVFTEAIRTATFHTDRMAQALDARLYATEVADYLVVKGVPFRQAHEMVASTVRSCDTAQRTLAQCTVQDLRNALPKALQKFAPAFADDVRDCFDPQLALKRRNLVGGTGPDAVQAQLREMDAWHATGGA